MPLVSKLQHKLYVLQKVIDSIIPGGVAVAMSPIALKFVPPPESMTTVFGTAGFAWIWSIVLFISCVSIIIGIFFRGRENQHGLPSKDTYIYFEYPGLISAFFASSTHGAAIFVVFGLPGLVSGAFSISIGLYFLTRWLKTKYTIEVAKAIVRRSKNKE